MTKKRTGKGIGNTPQPQDSEVPEDMFVVPDSLPVLPGRDLVAFPAVMMSLHVGREGSIRALEQAEENDGLIFILSQRDDEQENPAPDELYRIGVVANVIRVLKLPDNRRKVLLQGLIRARAEDVRLESGCIYADVDPLIPEEEDEQSAENEVLMNRIHENLQVLVEYEHLPEEMLLITEEADSPGMLADVVLAHYKLDFREAQQMLEEMDPIKRLKETDRIISDDLNQFLISERIRDKTRDELTKGQRDYYLREQLKQIQMELGEVDELSEDLTELRSQLEKAKLPTHAKQEADKQLSRLERMPQESSEYALLRTYLEWLADLPWKNRTRDRLDLKRAQKILDEDHYGLEKAKDRILEYLSVRKLNKDSRGPILCFVGPPGVGKTSLGRSIARALNRKFFRMSLGGVRDEAEIRGHRRTYVGALPGRLIQGLRQAGSKNAVFVLDELDKVGADFRGDPASALLEVLDPEQNCEFRDHYLNLNFDLSEIIFIATANIVDTIPDALLDRLEVIYLPGYTVLEKLEIAKRFLIPRQLKENGLAKYKIGFGDEAIQFLIERYTRESGVRNLEREIGSVTRKTARQVTEKGKPPKEITKEMIADWLGPTKFDPESREMADLVGYVHGLAWTKHGGEVLSVEASTAKGSGQLILTGRLGDVMQESAKAALFYARANADHLNLDPDFHSKLDIHVHVPGGATPKDGPSAGITIVVAVISALSGRKVSKDVAMTGEITLRGNVLPIGGLKEKALAAHLYGIKKVIIPYENIKDLEEIPKEQREQIRFVPVKHVSEVLEIALLDKTPSRDDKKTSAKRKSKRSKTVSM